MQRIVVGIDGSAAASAALTWAADESRRHRCPLVAVAVVDGHEPEREEEILARLRSIVQQAASGAMVEPVVRHGNPATQLAAVCTYSDLLVVGSQGRSALADMLLGSASRACIHLAPCNVAVIHPGPRPHSGITLVGIDGSTRARHALLAAADEARAHDSILHAVHAAWWNYLGLDLLPPADDDLLLWGKQLVDEELQLTEVNAEPQVVLGHPAEVLVDRSANADLLVVGSRGHNEPSTMVIGSISDQCSRRARCPVLVVR